MAAELGSVILSAAVREVRWTEDSVEVTTINLVYDRQFWRDDDLSGNVFSTDGSLGSIFDLGDESSDRPLLAVLFGGVAAAAVDKLSPEERKQRILSLTARALRPKAAHPIEYREQV